MRNRFGPVLARIALILVTIIGGFFLLEDQARAFEARIAVDLVHALGLQGIYSLGGGSVLVNPSGSSAFIAVVAPSCSSLAAVMCIVCLGAVMGRGEVGRRVAAVLAAVGVVIAGNIVRIAASLAAGLVWGRGTLVLFHDVAGSIFTFVYILGGFILLLFLILPKESARDVGARPAATLEATHA